MYHHVDQGWRKMPAFLSEENESLLATRIGEYVKANFISRILIVFHGGEPFLAGINTIERITNKIKDAIQDYAVADFSVQTNGTLLTESILDKIESLNISISLSIDGPKAIHDKHRIDHAGRPSFTSVEHALNLLQQRPQIFSGIIAVIDPFFPPDNLLRFFSAYEVPSLDFLLPDANYNHLPPGKNEQPSLYSDWVLKCFDLWFDHYPQLRVRFFDSVLSAVIGLPSKTDALGFGDVSLLTIETDGTYHDLDVLKIAYQGATNLNLGGVKTHSIEQAINSSQIQRHRSLLMKNGLSEICQHCDIVDICGGGAVPHRYSDKGFANPSIYCEELYALISHAKEKLSSQLENEIKSSKLDDFIALDKSEIFRFENSNYSFDMLNSMLESWSKIQRVKFHEALLIAKKERNDLSEVINDLLRLPNQDFNFLSLQPSVYIWSNVVNAVNCGQSVTTIDGKVMDADYSYPSKIILLLKEDFKTQRFNRDDTWLRAPFGERIVYENHKVSAGVLTTLNKAYDLINQWDQNILKEIKLIAPEIQFIKDLSADPEKIVSFSDNSVPGCLYVTVKINDRFIDPADLADSILHEYRHQKLYLLQRVSDIVYIDVPLVQSPWREELRPPSGLFHAIYVFCFLKKFWHFLSISSSGDLKDRAVREVDIIQKKILHGINTVKQTKLTSTGLELLNLLQSDLIEEVHEVFIS